jgi:hypothetical protein
MQRREAKNRPERPQGSPETERAERYPRKSPQKRPVLSRPGNLQFGGDWMVVSAVRYEPVSKDDSLLTGKLTGKFCDFGSFGDHSLPKVTVPQ